MKKLKKEIENIFAGDKRRGTTAKNLNKKELEYSLYIEKARRIRKGSPKVEKAISDFIKRNKITDIESNNNLISKTKKKSSKKVVKKRDRVLQEKDKKGEKINVPEEEKEQFKTLDEKIEVDIKIKENQGIFSRMFKKIANFFTANDQKDLPYTITNTTIDIFIDDQIKTVNIDHPNYNKILKELKRENYNVVRELLDVKVDIGKILNKDFEINDKTIKYQGSELNGALVERIIELARSDQDHKSIYPFLKFLKKVEKNPDPEAIEDLYLFLKSNKISITKAGNIILYKKITSDWKDCHTRTIDNSIGREVVLDRNKCDNDRNKTCSSGLHVAGYNYMNSFSGDRIILCEVNPKDVVSVPVDYNYSKMRVCRYKVIKEVTDSGDILEDIAVY